MSVNTAMLAAGMLLLAEVSVSEKAVYAQFTFVESPRTNLHVAVQPQRDYHRAHVMVRANNAAGKPLFARVRSVPGSSIDGTLDPQREAVTTTRFVGMTNDDLWSCYFRVPKYGSQTASYQVEFGSFHDDRVDQYQVDKSFAWEIYRDELNRGTMRVEGPDGAPAALPIEVRVAKCVGGSVIIEKRRATKAGPSDVTFGVTDQDAPTNVDGLAIVEKVN